MYGGRGGGGGVGGGGGGRRGGAAGASGQQQQQQQRASGVSAAYGGAATTSFTSDLSRVPLHEPEPTWFAAFGDKCVRFLEQFESVDENGDLRHKYVDQIGEIAARRRRVLEVHVDDMTGFDDDGELVRETEHNTMFVVSMLARAADQLMPPHLVDASDDFDPSSDPLSAFIEQHQQHQQQRRGAAGAGAADGAASQQQQQQQGDDDPMNVPNVHVDQLPAELKRRFEISLAPRTKVLAAARSVRSVLSADIGRLVAIRCMVTRVSSVRPQVRVATYTCETCGHEIFQEVPGRTFTPIVQCPSNTCRDNKSMGKPVLQTRGSKFVKAQDVRVQELPEQVPVGHIPRSMSISIHGELARALQPGDDVTVSGVFLPMPYTGFKAMRAGLLTETYLEAMHVLNHKRTKLPPSTKGAGADAMDIEAEERYSPELSAHLDRLAAERPDLALYDILAMSIAPEIFGHLDVKKALLLMLVANNQSRTFDGMRVRGDLNVCLVGDPGVAKSQLLRHVATLAPRGVYTSGRGSSGAGLTASVMRDPVTNEYVLEGGALVLADMGVCCIDEFDKMQDHDRTAIHEVMEQQTVSIAKAGITTTLNARTAVLAAANPQYGRYNTRRSVADNINMPTALLSRFDLLFLLIDRPDAERDRELAAHVLYVHQHRKHPENAEMARFLFSSALLREYVGLARETRTTVPHSIVETITRQYVEMRRESKDTQLVTARTLLCVVRLSLALARLRFAALVELADVEEAIRLLRTSQDMANAGEETRRVVDVQSEIFEIIRDYSYDQGNQPVRLADIAQLLRVRGITGEDLERTLVEYEQINVWQLSHDHSTVTFVQPAGL